MAVEKEDKEEKIVPVGDGADPAPPPEPEEKPAEESGTPEDDEEDRSERVGHSEDDEEEGKTDPEREAIRERRRKERKAIRDRTARERRELAFLRSRNEALERQVSKIALRQDQHEKVTTEQRVGTIEGQIREAESIYDKALINKDTETAAEARRVRDDLIRARDEAKASTPRETRQERTEDTPRQLTEAERRAFNRAKTWVERNDWFDPSLGDETSHIVKVMEDRMAGEVEFTAQDPEYWEELDRRVAKRFPELAKKKSAPRGDFDEDDDEPKRKEPPVKKSSGPRFSVGGKTRALKPNEVFIDAERRKAMEEAGVWEDEETRERYLKSYQRYDAEARKNS